MGISSETIHNRANLKRYTAYVFFNYKNFYPVKIFFIRPRNSMQWLTYRCRGPNNRKTMHYNVRQGADKSLARPTSCCHRTKSIASLEIRACSCVELQAFSCYWGGKGECQVRRAISTTSKRELVNKFFFSCKARRRRKFTPFWQKY